MSQIRRVAPGRSVVILLVAATAACGARGSGLEDLSAAGSCRPVEAVLGEDATMEYMAGEYRLRLVGDSGGETLGEVDLEANPAAYRDRDASTATLMGTASVRFSDVGGQDLRGLDSSDPSAPGVLVVEAAGNNGKEIFVRFGSAGNTMGSQRFDAAYASLDVRAIEGDRFFGLWQSGVEAERAEGYFCAQRIEP